MCRTTSLSAFITRRRLERSLAISLLCFPMKTEAFSIHFGGCFIHSLLVGPRKKKYSVRAGGSGDEGKVARRKETNSWKIDFSGEKPATPLLDTINYPIHMRNLSTRDLDQLAAELRADIVYSVSKTGGHLSSSLGVVELSADLDG
ncbi:hypothetical protein AAC387_Pa03g1356 [Persea americana]